MSNFTGTRWFRDALIAPSPELGDVAERERTRLLSGLLLALFGLGLLSGVLQLLLVSNVLPTFVVTAIALVGIGFAYVLSRTGRYRVAAGLAACVIVVACAAAGLANPHDHVWYAFMMIAVLLASTFLTLSGAVAIAALALITVAVVAASTDHARAAWLAPVMFHAVFSPLLLVLSHRRAAALERRYQVERQHERESFERRHLEAIGRMASGIAHDFTNLLTVVLGNCRILLDRRAYDETSLTDIRDAAERGTQFVQQLLAFARKERIEPEVLDLNQVLSDIEPMLNRVVGSKVQLQIDRAPMLPSVKADPVQLERALLNLAGNARDAMPAGGTLRIATAAHPQANVGSGNSGDRVVLRVGDTGVGMDENTRASIFEPFFTTREHEGGTGLGLAIVRGFVIQSGGRIHVDSEVGRGTTFEIELPSAGPAA
jgi:signal transduction histidine kinase